MSVMSIRPPFFADMKLGDARELLRGMSGDGERCPCCTQFVKVYERTINSTMACGLVAVWARARREFAHVPSLLEDAGLAAKMGGQFAKLRYWGLIEEKPDDERADGGHAGYWRVTALGELWIRGETEIQKIARIFDGRCLGLKGDLITLSQALREPFDLNAVMAAHAEPLSPGDNGQLFDLPSTSTPEAA